MSADTVLVTDPIGGDASAIAATLAAHGISTITPSRGQHWHELAETADGLIVNLATVDAAAFDHLTRCRVIARLGVGINNVDVATARTRSVVVTNVPDYCREEVSDHTLALILAMGRKLPIANANVQRGVWDQLGQRPIRRLKTLTLGLVGFGRIAQAVARKASAFGMRVIAYDPFLSPASAPGSVELVPLPELLGAADVISLHVPLLADNNNLIGRTQFDQMKSGAILVNTSRGELVDEAALCAALDANHLSAAALDVAAVEPLAAGSSLRGRANVLLTPHMAFYSEESLIDLQRTAAEDVARVLSGNVPVHRIA